MSSHWYVAEQKSVSWAKDRINLRRNSKRMRPFPAAAPLESVAIDVPV